MKIQLRYTCSAYHHDAGLIVLPPKSVPCHGRVVYRQSFTQAKNCFLYAFTPEPLIPHPLLRQWKALSCFSPSCIKGTEERKDVLSSSLPLAPCCKTSVLLLLPEKH